MLNELNLKITVDNPTDETIKGNLVIDLPEDWELEGDTSITVKPETKKEFVLKLKTNGKELEQEIPVTLEIDNGKEITTDAEFTRPGLSTALFSLAENAGAVIGLLVIVIVVIILLVKK